MHKSPHGGDIYRHQNVIDFSANINPLGPPPKVIAAVAQNAVQIQNYPDVYCRTLTEKIAGKENIPADYIICGNGAAELIFSLVLARKPKSALLLSPTFAEYEQALKTVDCDIRYFDLNMEEGYAVTDKIVEQITKDLDIFFLCNPNNPTGRLTDQQLLHKILEKCSECGILFVVDECFIDFTDFLLEHTMIPQLLDYPNLLILKAFTKLYAMPGLRLGYGLCSDKILLGDMSAAVQPWNVSVLAQSAGIAALLEEDYVTDSLNLIRRERERLAECIRRKGWQVYPPAANYIFFRGTADFYDAALAEGILVRDCSNYRGLCKGDYRIAVKLPHENSRLIEIIDNYGIIK